jgi:hypothetical protein
MSFTFWLSALGSRDLSQAKKEITFEKPGKLTKLQLETGHQNLRLD